jgi:predicted dinucleotide-binding enzyme
MSTVSIIGSGNMAKAIGGIVEAGGNTVEYIGRDSADIAGDIVVLAVPYPEVETVIATHGPAIADKTVVDITNPLDFSTFDDLVVPADSSAAAVIASKLPDAKVLKAFNTTFASTLVTKTVGTGKTTVLIAGDDADAKKALADVITAGGVAAVDAGSLKRARELEAVGFQQLVLAANEKISWGGGFGLHA